MTLMSYRALLDKKINEAFCREWHPQRRSRAEVFDADNGTGLRLFVQRRDGSWVQVHKEPPVVLEDEDDVSDLLARGLSAFLMKHPEWPR
jgi:hypothetical protein